MACYFLLNYARARLPVRHPNRQRYQLAIFFWIMLPFFLGGLMFTIGFDLLFSFELCTAELEKLKEEYEKEWSLLFSFELCGTDVSRIHDWVLNYILLFSFELCIVYNSVQGVEPLCCLAIFFWIMQASNPCLVLVAVKTSQLAIFFWIMRWWRR